MAAPVFTAADYVTRLQVLLPPGRAMTRDPSATLTKLLTGLSGWLEDSNADANALLVDAFPATAVGLLPEWEAALDLPGQFGVAPPTISGRQAAAVAALTNTGGQSKAYLIALAAALGYAITISEFVTYGVDQGVDTPINGDACGSMFVVHASVAIAIAYTPVVDIVQATPGLGNPALEAMLAAAKPAASVCITSYT